MLNRALLDAGGARRAQGVQTVPGRDLRSAHGRRIEIERSRAARGHAGRVGTEPARRFAGIDARGLGGASEVRRCRRNRVVGTGLRAIAAAGAGAQKSLFFDGTGRPQDWQSGLRSGQGRLVGAFLQPCDDPRKRGLSGRRATLRGVGIPRAAEQKRPPRDLAHGSPLWSASAEGA